MTPKEIVLSGYKAFSEGDMEGLGKVFHKDAVIKVNGEHEFSGEYQGFDDWLNNFLVHLPTNYPNFDLSILNIIAEDKWVHVHVKYTADNLDAEGVHMFVVEGGYETEFYIFDDSQKLAKALENKGG